MILLGGQLLLYTAHTSADLLSQQVHKLEQLGNMSHQLVVPDCFCQVLLYQLQGTVYEANPIGNCFIEVPILQSLALTHKQIFAGAARKQRCRRVLLLGVEHPCFERLSVGIMKLAQWLRLQLGEAALAGPS